MLVAAQMLFLKCPWNFEMNSKDGFYTFKNMFMIFSDEALLQEYLKSDNINI